VGAADTVAPIEAHVYAALRSGDMTFEQMQEFGAVALRLRPPSLCGQQGGSRGIV
jgi:hypothetical protein